MRTESSIAIAHASPGILEIEGEAYSNSFCENLEGETVAYFNWILEKRRGLSWDAFFVNSHAGNFFVKDGSGVAAVKTRGAVIAAKEKTYAWWALSTMQKDKLCRTGLAIFNPSLPFLYRIRTIEIAQASLVSMKGYFESQALVEVLRVAKASPTSTLQKNPARFYGSLRGDINCPLMISAEK